MKRISDETWNALTAFAALRSPSPARVLEWNGHIYEANCAETLTFLIEKEQEPEHGSDSLRPQRHIQTQS
jgi:hypothetical protein